MADVITRRAVAREEVFADADCLDYGNAVRGQALAQSLEVCRPITLADGLKHFDRDDRGEGSVLLAVVLQLNVSGLADALGRVGVLAR